MSHDPYCHPGSAILKNHLGILDQDHLARVESRLAALALARLREQALPQQVDEARLKATHRAIFRGFIPSQVSTGKIPGR